MRHSESPVCHFDNAWTGNGRPSLFGRSWMRRSISSGPAWREVERTGLAVGGWETGEVQSRVRQPGRLRGGRKMKHGAKVAKGTGTRLSTRHRAVEAFVGRSLERARKLGRGERLPSEITMTFEDPSDLARILSAQRLRVLRAVRTKPTTVFDLAVRLKRDRKAVRRDVNLLESYGLVTAREECNPGHGRRRVIEPRAARYQLVATI